MSQRQTLTDLSSKQLESRLSGPGVFFQIGPFNVHLTSRAPQFAQTLSLLYRDVSILHDPQSQIIDFYVRMLRPGTIRFLLQPQIRFQNDNASPFTPFPLTHVFPHFEWGINWCIAMQAHHYLLFHSAVLERNGRAILLPAEPGSGKSTLCSALMLSGWRLLSDEFGLYRPETGLIDAIPRPIPLKNESIAIIKDFSDEAVLGPVYKKTRKGDVAHLRPSRESMQRYQEPAKPAWVVFPRYQAGARELLHPFAKGRAFLKLSGNSFNYRLQGARGFQRVADLVENCDTYYLEFSNLERAVDLLDQLVESNSNEE